MNEYYYENLNKFKHDKKCWKFQYYTMIRTSKSDIKLRDEHGNLISNDAPIAQKFNEFFATSTREIKQQIEVHLPDSCNSLRTLRQHQNNFVFSNTSNNEINEIIKSLDGAKASESDGIYVKTFVECVQELSPLIKSIFNDLVNTIPIPKEIHTNTICC